MKTWSLTPSSSNGFYPVAGVDDLRILVARRVVARCPTELRTSAKRVDDVGVKRVESGILGQGVAVMEGCVTKVR